MEVVQVEVMSDDEQQLNSKEFQMFGNPEGGDHIELGEAQRSAAFGGNRRSSRLSDSPGKK